MSFLVLDPKISFHPTEPLVLNRPVSGDLDGREVKTLDMRKQEMEMKREKAVTSRNHHLMTSIAALIVATALAILLGLALVPTVFAIISIAVTGVGSMMTFGCARSLQANIRSCDRSIERLARQALEC
jgi:hypothetical protein